MIDKARVTPAISPLGAARRAVRQHARRLLRNPGDAESHLARLQASLDLTGAEPVQGALAELFTCFGVGDERLKRTALQLARERLSVHVFRQFEAQVSRATLPAINLLATRWSVLAHPSADTSTRARRCSVDDSRVLADQAVRAYEVADLLSQQEFLHHCVTCHDNLAFMLARRALLKSGVSLPDDWAAVSEQLEQSREFA